MDSEMINKQNNDTSLLPVKLKLEPLENILDALQQDRNLETCFCVVLNILLAMRVTVDQA